MLKINISAQGSAKNLYSILRNQLQKDHLRHRASNLLSATSQQAFKISVAPWFYVAYSSFLWSSSQFQSAATAKNWKQPRSTQLNRQDMLDLKYIKFEQINCPIYQFWNQNSLENFENPSLNKNNFKISFPYKNSKWLSFPINWYLVFLKMKFEIKINLN